MNWSELIEEHAEKSLHRDTRTPCVIREYISKHHLVPLQVGDLIYVYDENQRVYPTEDQLKNDWPGLCPPRHTHASIWRSHFVLEQIKAENRVSWFTCTLDSPSWKLKDCKYPKVRGKDHRKRNGLLGFEYYVSKAEIDEAEYVHELRPHVSRLLESVVDPEMLKAVIKAMKLDGFKPGTWPGVGR